MNRKSGFASPKSSFGGVTLVEVLMSLMIMSIGLASVAVLFPISVLRSVQATQMTNAALLKYNAEALIQINPGIVFDPDGDGNFDEHIRSSTEARYIIDPSGYFELAAGGAGYATNPSLSAGNDPSFPNDNAERGLVDWIGNTDTDSTNVSVNTPVPVLSLPRYDGGIRMASANSTFPLGLRPFGGDPEEARTLRMLGSTLSKLGDGWESVTSALPVKFVFSDGTTGANAIAGAAIVGLELPLETDLASVMTARSSVPVIGTTQLIPDPELCRVVVFSLDAGFSQSLPLILADDSTKRVLWSEDIDFDGTPDAGEDVNQNGQLDIRPLSTQFTVWDAVNSQNIFQVGQVTLQNAKTHDYNWLLTVRRGLDGQTRGVDVVVTHNKGITTDDERVFSATFSTASPFVFAVLKDSGQKINNEPAEPLLKRSGYVLDVGNARWYRIRDYREATVTIGSVTGPGYFVDVENPIVANAASGAAMFLPGVIDVYPMGGIPIP